MRLREIIWVPEIAEKVQRKHRLEPGEVEEACFGAVSHIRRARQGRYALLGRTEAGRYVIVVFQHLGRESIRIITARDMTDSEQDLYERHAR